MSVKTTQRVTRARALEVLLREIPQVGNDVLGDLMDVLAESGQSKVCSRFDNFIVSEFGEGGRDE
jgi:hypothetical protein